VQRAVQVLEQAQGGGCCQPPACMAWKFALQGCVDPSNHKFQKSSPLFNTASASSITVCPSSLPKFHSILAYIPSTRTRFQYRNRTCKKTKATAEQGVKMWSVKGSPRPGVEVDD